MTPADLVNQWRREAEHVRPYNAGAAHAYEEAARQLEAALVPSRVVVRDCVAVGPMQVRLGRMPG